MVGKHLFLVGISCVFHAHICWLHYLSRYGDLVSKISRYAVLFFFRMSIKLSKLAKVLNFNIATYCSGSSSFMHLNQNGDYYNAGLC